MSARTGTRPPPPLSHVSLRARAEEHLRRFSPSEAQMRTVLQRRVDRCLGAHGGDPVAASAILEAVLAELLACGLLDDRRLSLALAESLHRRGVAGRAMPARLRARGLDPGLLGEAISAVNHSLAEPELLRACTFARRRRLGAARPAHRRSEDPNELRRHRERDIGALCRAGFSLGIALRVVDSADLDLLSQEAQDGPR